MAALSDYLENGINQWVFRNTALAARGTGDLSVRLYTVTPSDSGGGTAVSGGSYADQVLPANATYWTVPGTPGAVTNALDINFPVASGSWGTVVAVGILDNSGNLLYWGALTANKTVASGDSFKFAAGQLSITTDN